MKKTLLLSILVLFGCGKETVFTKEEVDIINIPRIETVGDNPYKDFQINYTNNSILNRVPILFRNYKQVISQEYGEDFAILDYNNDGFYDLVMGNSNYQASFAGIPDRKPFIFYFGDANGNLIYDPINSTKFLSLLHGKIGIVNDFNNDGYLDIFFAGHALDSPNAPKDQWGDYPIILENDKNGSFIQYNINEAYGYWHHATTGDINNDGKIDIILNSPAVNSDRPGYLIEYINNEYKASKWNHDLTSSKTFNKFSHASVDFNNDGIDDMVYGSTEFNNSPFHQDTFIGSFIKLSNGEIIEIPKVGYENTMVYDFQVNDIDNDGDYDLFVLRSEGTTNKKNYIQLLRNDIYNFVDITESNPLENITGDPRITRIIITDSDSDGIYELRIYSFMPVVWAQTEFLFEIIDGKFIQKN